MGHHDVHTPMVATGPRHGPLDLSTHFMREMARNQSRQTAVNSYQGPPRCFAEKSSNPVWCAAGRVHPSTRGGEHAVVVDEVDLIGTYDMGTTDLELADLELFHSRSRLLQESNRDGLELSALVEESCRRHQQHRSDRGDNGNRRGQDPPRPPSVLAEDVERTNRPHQTNNDQGEQSRSADEERIEPPEVPEWRRPPTVMLGRPTQ